MGNKENIHPTVAPPTPHLFNEIEPWPLLKTSSPPLISSPPNCVYALAMKEGRKEGARAMALCGSHSCPLSSPLNSTATGKKSSTLADIPRHMTYVKNQLSNLARRQKLIDYKHKGDVLKTHWFVVYPSDKTPATYSTYCPTNQYQEGKTCISFSLPNTQNHLDNSNNIGHEE